MSRRLVSLVQDRKDIPRKYKSVLLAWAKFANNDGTNIFASKDKVAEAAGCSRFTVYRHTEAMLASGVLVPAQSHTCRVEECKKGFTHYWGVYGQYTTAYNLDIRMLQNATRLTLKNSDSYVAKTQKGHVAKRLNRHVAKCDTTQALNPTPPAVAENPDSSALTSRENQVSELVSEETGCSAPLRNPMSPGVSKPENSSDHETPYDQHSRVWIEAGEFFNSIWPNKPIREEHVTLLLDLVDELGHGDWIRGGERLKAAWSWNQTHKKGKYKLYSLTELAKALRSTNDRSLLNQMAMDDGCPLCPEVVDKPPVSAPPPIQPEPEPEPEPMAPTLCPHGNDWGHCKRCEEEAARRNQCQHGNPSATCYDCMYPPNAYCRWKECARRFHAEDPNPNHRFCSPECRAKFEAREKELAAKYAPKKEKHPLAAFMEGE